MSSFRWYMSIIVFAVALSWSVSLDSPVARGVVHGVVIVFALWVGRAEGYKDALTEKK